MSFDVVGGHSADDLEERYRRQPSRAAAEESGQERRDLPGRMGLRPGVTTFSSNTLICRTFQSATQWDEDVSDYFVVVTHQRSPWSEAQKKKYLEQRYALAVELHDEGRSDLDLYGIVRSQLQTRLRARE
jgi:hypothetical protein